MKGAYNLAGGVLSQTRRCRVVPFCSPSACALPAADSGSVDHHTAAATSSPTPCYSPHSSTEATAATATPLSANVWSSSHAPPPPPTAATPSIRTTTRQLARWFPFSDSNPSTTQRRRIHTTSSAVAAELELPAPGQVEEGAEGKRLGGASPSPLPAYSYLNEDTQKSASLGRPFGGYQKEINHTVRGVHSTTWFIPGSRIPFSKLRPPEAAGRSSSVVADDVDGEFYPHSVEDPAWMNTQKAVASLVEGIIHGPLPLTRIFHEKRNKLKRAAEHAAAADIALVDQRQQLGGGVGVDSSTTGEGSESTNTPSRTVVVADDDLLVDPLAEYWRLLDAEHRTLITVDWHPSSRMAKWRRERSRMRRSLSENRSDDNISKEEAEAEFRELECVVEENRQQDGRCTTRTTDDAVWSQCFVSLRPRTAKRMLHWKGLPETRAVTAAQQDHLASTVDCFRLARLLADTSLEIGVPLAEVEEVVRRGGDTVAPLSAPGGGGGGGRDVQEVPGRIRVPTFGFPTSVDSPVTPFQVALSFPQYYDVVWRDAAVANRDRTAEQRQLPPASLYQQVSNAGRGAPTRTVRQREAPSLSSMPISSSPLPLPVVDHDRTPGGEIFGSASVLSSPTPQKLAHAPSERTLIPFLRFKLDEKMYVPQGTEEELLEQLTVINADPRWSALFAGPEHSAVRAIKGSLVAGIMMKFHSGPISVFADSNVTAVYFYDQLPLTGTPHLVDAKTTRAYKDACWALSTMPLGNFCSMYSLLFRRLHVDDGIAVHRSEIPPPPPIDYSRATALDARNALMKNRIRINPKNCFDRELNNVFRTMCILPRELQRVCAERLGGVAAVCSQFPRDFICYWRADGRKDIRFRMCEKSSRDKFEDIKFWMTLERVKDILLGALLNYDVDFLQYRPNWTVFVAQIFKLLPAVVRKHLNYHLGGAAALCDTYPEIFTVHPDDLADFNSSRRRDLFYVRVIDPSKVASRLLEFYNAHNIHDGEAAEFPELAVPKGEEYTDEDENVNRRMLSVRHAKAVARTQKDTQHQHWR